MLDLHSNDTFMIYNNSFSLLVKLQRLSLGKNNLKLLEIDTFMGLYSLQILDLSDNSLLSLEPCIFADIPRPFSLILLGKEDSGTFIRTPVGTGWGRNLRMELSYRIVNGSPVYARLKVFFNNFFQFIIKVSKGSDLFSQQ